MVERARSGSSAVRDVGELLEVLVPKHEAVLHAAQGRVAELRDDIVRRGKKSDKFRAFARDRGRTGPKYSDAGDVEHSGSACVEDCLFLYLLVLEFRPSMIFELGTWLGTTSAVLAAAQRDAGVPGVVHTCDKNDVFLDELAGQGAIHRHSGDCGRHLSTVRDRLFDFAFLDGVLGLADARRLVARFRRPPVVAVHDWFAGKGSRNVECLRRAVNHGTVFAPVAERAPYTVRGLTLNAGTALFVTAWDPALASAPRAP